MAPCSGVSARSDPGSDACFSMALTSSTVVSRPTMKTISVIEELSIGTRIAWPFSLPLSSGKTSATAVADPVEVGARLSMPERARRRSDFLSLTMSTSDCVPVMLCTVVIIPFSIVSCSWMTLIMGAIQLVVHEAAVQMTCLSSRRWSLQPTTTFRTEGSFTGADTTTRFTPHTSRYGCRSLTLRNLPVQSSTSSTPIAFQSTCVKSALSEKVTLLPSIEMLVGEVQVALCPHVPCTESYCTR
mmetsp:Transcript_13746/g.23499  ORF Transcript_13746/g.23499 Transcript_13746/m.23499 type:complete len:243 (+) Transcript_13746:623-1351(+)